MNKLKIIFVGLIVGITSACESGGQDSNSSQSHTGSFNVSADGLFEYDDTGKRVKLKNFQNRLWEFKSDSYQLRISGRFDDEKIGVEQKSLDLIHNNVYLSFPFKNGTGQVAVSCKAAQEPKGQILRTVHDNKSSSGSFSIELVSCSNKYSSEPVNGIQTPFTIKGQFRDIAYSDSPF